jgi:hypothetical protein
MDAARGEAASGGKDLHTCLAQPRDHRLADALSAARDERPAAFQFETVAHERISSDAIHHPNVIEYFDTTATA